MEKSFSSSIFVPQLWGRNAKLASTVRIQVAAVRVRVILLPGTRGRRCTTRCPRAWPLPPRERAATLEGGRVAPELD